MAFRILVVLLATTSFVSSQRLVTILSNFAQASDVSFFKNTFPWVIDNIGYSIELEYHFKDSGKSSGPRKCALSQIKKNAYLQATYLQCEAQGNPIIVCQKNAFIQTRQLNRCIRLNVDKFVRKAERQFYKYKASTTPTIIIFRGKKIIIDMDPQNVLREICSIFKKKPLGCIYPSPVPGLPEEGEQSTIMASSSTEETSSSEETPEKETTTTGYTTSLSNQTSTPEGNSDSEETGYSNNTTNNSKNTISEKTSGLEETSSQQYSSSETSVSIEENSSAEESKNQNNTITPQITSTFNQTWVQEENSGHVGSDISDKTTVNSKNTVSEITPDPKETSSEPNSSSETDVSTEKNSSPEEGKNQGNTTTPQITSTSNQSSSLEEVSDSVKNATSSETTITSLKPSSESNNYEY